MLLLRTIILPTRYRVVPRKVPYCIHTLKGWARTTRLQQHSSRILFCFARTKVSLLQRVEGPKFGGVPEQETQMSTTQLEIDSTATNLRIPTTLVLI